MTGAGPLAAAAAELYAADPAEFTGRRAELVASARAAGDAGTARQIAGLRKPTRSAWLINQLVRADPEVPDRLARLGGELRAAAESLDGARIRESSQSRRRLVDEMVSQALRLAGQQAPGAGVREELTATFSAALADPEVARQLAAGTLVRPVRREGVAGPGLELGAALELVPARGPAGRRARGNQPPSRRQAPRRAAPARQAEPGRHAEPADQAEPAGQAEPARRAGPARSGQRRQDERARAQRARQQAERERAERERADRARRQQWAAAQRAVLDAQRAAGAAADAEAQLRGELHRLEDQLADLRDRISAARHRLGAARQRTRAAQRAEQTARQAAQRLDS